MRYRALDENGDYTFGRGAENFLVNNAATVRQSVLTRLRLLRGEWYLNLTSGTPWFQEVLDKGHSSTYDLVIQTRILQTNGVDHIDKYQSVYDPVTRRLQVACLIYTIYSTEAVPLDTTLGATS